MIFNWLSNTNTSDKEAKSEVKRLHEVLGTDIYATPKPDQEVILFACGCFWGAEKGFWKLPGVITTAVGYAGGETINPTYNQVCSGRTGHTEVVKVLWDKNLLDLSDLLKMFWECHDPTQGNRQGNDRGTQYRSAIYTTNNDQMRMANASKLFYEKALKDKGLKQITTEINENQTFYYAEGYHQQYLAKPGARPYCSAMPTKTILGDFPGSRYKLKKEIWLNFDWEINHCVLRSDNEPISL